MNISGLQKLTLLDYPKKVACTVFLAGCNLCCPFCHNSGLLTAKAPSVMSEEEFFSFLKKRQGLLDAVCITGGEPTLQPELEVFISQIKELGYLVKLDTNGCSPKVLSELLEKGLLDYVAMDIKNSPSRYAKTVGASAFHMDPILESIRILMEGKVDYEFRTTVVEEFHDREAFLEIKKMLQEISPVPVKKYFLQLFTERDSVVCLGLHAPTEEKMKEYVRLMQFCAENVYIRGL